MKVSFGLKSEFRHNRSSVLEATTPKARQQMLPKSGKVALFHRPALESSHLELHTWILSGFGEPRCTRRRPREDPTGLKVKTRMAA